MRAPLLIALPGNEAMTECLVRLTGAEAGTLESRDFPDGETYLRFAEPLQGRSIALVATLARPNAKIPPLLFAAAAARDLGARRIGLVAPYLCYMRQDVRFHPGEAVTSRHFASLVSSAFDWLVTMDPHLHRYHALDEIYSIPARALHAGPALAEWIAANIERPFLIGPDTESAQWVSAVASACGAPFAILSKQRLGDRDVRIASQALGIGEHTPVLLDDVISSGRTILAALSVLGPQFRRPPVVIAIHGILADDAERAFAAAGARLVTTNTIPNSAAQIDVAGLQAPVVAEFAR